MAKFAAGNAIRVVPGEVMPELDWELLYDVHAPKLRRVIQRKVGAAMADDVLQETFLRAFKNRATIDRTRPIEPWLVTIALRTAADLQRLQLRTLETADATVDDIEVASADSVEDELLSRARRMGIKHAFASLNTRQRRLLQLVTIEGMSYEGVADAERMTPDAVKSALARARTNFKTSYVGFERESRLFGGAMVLGVLNRLRRRLQRYQAFVGGHMAGVGAAATTVAVVAVAAVPAVRPMPTSATERVQSSAATASTDIAPMHAPVLPAASTGVSPTSTRDQVPTPPAQAAGRVAIDAGTSRNGSQFSAQATTKSTTDGGETRGRSTSDVYCQAGDIGRTTCSALDVVPDLAAP